MAEKYLWVLQELELQEMELILEREDSAFIKGFIYMSLLSLLEF
jgi:hypothetical protein